ncbi:hypothetical protein CBR_g30000 [Chara braunii]|uniref:Chromo domain-containing protein n=1 Tax=Chara braunii TaxID=69332 RepID=A0A388LBR9_CHABU|nr:hypothetical protein CBR_g30000 [Chara braunii]|eukprot:GBG79736.1 hypothetical protein CBR_g30000 [Chara braunii]
MDRPYGGDYEARKSLADSQTRMAARANRSRMYHPLKVGDDVLVDARHLQLEADTLHKFRRHFFGPCRILQAVDSDIAASPVSFRVKLPHYLRQARVHDVYHVSLLRPYCKPSERFAGRPYGRPPPIMVDGHKEFVVSDIVSRRVTDDTPPRIEYLVRWKGYPDEEVTWEPLEHLQHARMLVRTYDRARRAETSASTQPTDPLPPPLVEEIAEDAPAPFEAVPQPQTVAELVLGGGFVLAREFFDMLEDKNIVPDVHCYAGPFQELSLPLRLCSGCEANGAAAEGDDLGSGPATQLHRGESRGQFDDSEDEGPTPPLRETQRSVLSIPGVLTDAPVRQESGSCRKGGSLFGGRLGDG